MPLRDVEQLRQHRRHRRPRHADVLGEHRSEPLQRRVCEAARREERLRLGVVAGLHGPQRVAVLERRDDAARLVGAALAGGVDPGEQQHLRLGLEPEVLPLLDGGEALAVEQLQRVRGQAAAGDGGDGDAGVDEVVEGADDGARRAGESRAQPQGDLGDDAERSLRTDHQAAEVKSRNAFRGPATEPDRVAVAGGTAHDRPHTEDVVAGDAVLEAAEAAGVGRDVAADRRPRRARGVRRVPEALLAHERLEIVVDDAGLDDADEVVGVDLDDLVHPREVEDEAAVDGVRAAGQAGTRAPRDDRHAEVGADADRLLDLRLGARSQRRQGRADRRPLGVVRGQAGHDVAVGDEPLLGDRP